MADMTETEQEILYSSGYNGTAAEEFVTLESGLQAGTYSAPEVYDGWRIRAPSHNPREGVVGSQCSHTSRGTVGS